MLTSTATDSSGLRHGRDRGDGFTLIEVSLAMAIMAMLALLGLPYLHPRAGERAVHQKAVEVVGFLRMERNAAMRSGEPRRVEIDTRKRQLTSLVSGARLTIPANLHLRFLQGVSNISFTPDGRSSGARFLLYAGQVAILIEVNGITAAVQMGGARS